MLSIRKAMEALPLVTFYIYRPPSPTCYPPAGAIGATLGTATNNLYSSPKKVYTHYITLLFYFNWIWRRSLIFAKFWPLGALPLGPHCGHMYHMNTFVSPAPEDDSCQVWLKSQPCISSRSRWTVTFDIGPTPQPVTPGGHGATPGNCHQQPLFFT